MNSMRAVLPKRQMPVWLSSSWSGGRALIFIWLKSLYIVNKHKFKHFTNASSNRWLEGFLKTSLAWGRQSIFFWGCHFTQAYPTCGFPIMLHVSRTKSKDILLAYMGFSFFGQPLKLIWKPTLPTTIVPLPKLRYFMMSTSIFLASTLTMEPESTLEHYLFWASLLASLSFRGL